MASNRDATTRRLQRQRRERIANGRMGINQTISQFAPKVRLNAEDKAEFGNSASLRQRGRRGVRARRREARIAQRMMNGTYTQPSGGTITNS